MKTVMVGPWATAEERAYRTPILRTPHRVPPAEKQENRQRNFQGNDERQEEDRKQVEQHDGAEGFRGLTGERAAE